MTPELTLALRRSATARAHIYGAEALIFEKQAAELLSAAAASKRRYFRELECANLLGGHRSDTLAALGRRWRDG